MRVCAFSAEHLFGRPVILQLLSAMKIFIPTLVLTLCVWLIFHCQPSPTEQSIVAALVKLIVAASFSRLPPVIEQRAVRSMLR